MKRMTITIFGFIFALAVGALLWPNLGSPARADRGCVAFQAIVQATLPTSTPLAATDIWGGPLYGSLGGELLLGILSGNDGSATGHGKIGQGRGGAYTVGTGCAPGPLYVCTDSFTYEVSNAVWPAPPGKIGFGHYIGNTATIVSGTGRFQNASGNLNISGPFIAWEDSNSPLGVYGRWNSEISGTVCGIQ